MIADCLRVLGLSALAACAAIVLVLALRKPLRARFGAHVAYAQWLLVPIASAVVLLPAPLVPIALRLMPIAATPVLVAAVPVAHSPAYNFDATLWLGVTWLLGVGVCAVLLIWQQRRFVRALGHLSALDERTVRAEAIAGCPALVGAWRPRVVLPADFEQRYTPKERELILAHERAHCARGDAQLNALAAVLRCLFWFNPLVHIAASRFRFDQELACDAAVITRFPEARRPYADAMLKTQLADLGLPAGCYWQSSHPLKERIAMLKQPLPGRTRRALGLGLTAALVFGGSYAAWAMQPATASATSADASKPAAAQNGAQRAAQSHANYRKLRRIAYPATALEAKQEGVVYVDVHIAVDGTVASATAERTDPQVAKELAETAVSGVRTWTFEPATNQGKPIESDEVVPVVFALEPQDTLKASHGTLDAIYVSLPQPEVVSEARYRQPMTAPNYPAAALAARQSGKITLKVRIDEQGNPKAATVFKAEPPEAEAAFADASIAAVMQWKFEPRIVYGKPVADEFLVPIAY